MQLRAPISISHLPVKSDNNVICMEASQKLTSLSVIFKSNCSPVWPFRPFDFLTFPVIFVLLSLCPLCPLVLFVLFALSWPVCACQVSLTHRSAHRRVPLSGTTSCIAGILRTTGSTSLAGPTTTHTSRAERAWMDTESSKTRTWRRRRSGLTFRS